MPENTGYFDMTDGRWVAAQSDNTHEYVITAHPVVHTVSAGFWKTYKKWKAGGSIETLPIVTAIIFVDVRLRARRRVCCAGDVELCW